MSSESQATKQPGLVQVGETFLRVDQIASARWDEGSLYVYLVGGRFLRLDGVPAGQLVQLLGIVSEKVTGKAR